MNEPALDTTISYQLAQLCKTHRQRVQEVLAPLDLHVGQEMILLRLWQADDCTQAELAASLCVQPATVTRMLGRLERDGLVTRHSDPHDQRALRVCLTEAGRAMEAPVRAAWRQIEAAILDEMTPAEYLMLKRLLTKLAGNLAEPVAQRWAADDARRVTPRRFGSPR